MNQAVFTRMPWQVRLLVRLMRLRFRMLSAISKQAASRAALRMFLTPPRALERNWRRVIASPARRIAIRLRDKDLVATEFGEGARTVLLVHGWGGRGADMADFVQPLVDRGMRVVWLDGPAHGDSAGPSTDMFEFAASITAACENLRSVEAIIGHSFGAACTLLANQQAALPVRKLVLVGCFADAIFITKSFGEFLRIPQHVIAAMRSRLTARYGDRWTWEEIAPLKLVTAAAMPILFVHDADDDEVPFEQAAALVAAGHDTRVHQTRGQGHRKILRHTTAVGSAIEFIASDAEVVGA